MKLRGLLLLLTSSFVTLTHLSLPATASAQASADVIVEWNRAVGAALAVPGAHPSTTSPTRPYAMVHAAIFDALTAIDPQFAPYAITLSAAPGASRDAAAAQAAHDVAVSLMPTQASRFDQLLAARLATIDPGAAAAGSAVGAAAARTILDKRANDSWNRGASAYRLAALPGYWQPTPPANANATFVRYQFVQGFIVNGPRILIGEGPPALTSERYASAFNEVKALGSATSTTRTEEQTQIARLWAGVGTSTTAIGAWNVALQDLARTQQMTDLEAARMFALANMVAHDALMVSFTGKFRYALWRPVTAIRDAARDGNDATEIDSEWLPLVNTPSYPTYPGNTACLGASQSRLLGRLFGHDDIPVTITWTGTGSSGQTVSRSYSGFPQIADEAAISRVYAGVNFGFDAPASYSVCTPLADYAIENYMRRK
jgi:hypothetical protein